jgi:holo-[acyl-carrier protein] synthase
MKISVGIDLVENKRIQSVFEEFKEKFLEKVFTESEIEYCLSKKDPVPYLAARFAVKEAFVKAVNLPQKVSLNWKDMEFGGNYFGKKELKISGKALEYFSMGSFESISTSITHTDNFASAVVILYGKETTV